MAGAHIPEKLQDPENPEESQYPDYDQILPAYEKDAQISRQDGQKIYYAVKAEDIPFFWPVNYNDPEDILDGEKDGEEPFGNVEIAAVPYVQRSHAVEEDYKNAQQDGNQQ